jgi:hypothetical protein
MMRSALRIHTYENDGNHPCNAWPSLLIELATKILQVKCWTNFFQIVNDKK